MNKQPNILVLFSDQHNAKVLSHEGHASVRTPNLDRLAAGGTRFRSAVCANPICTPSRVSFLSGQYCHNHGYYGLDGPHPGGLPGFLGHFRANGYRTAAFGKIHCPEYWVEDQCDVFHDTCGNSVGGRSKSYLEFLGGRDATNREDHGTFREFPHLRGQPCDGRPSNASFEESQEGWAAARTADFIEKAAADGKPFCAFLSFPKPHQTYAPAKEFWDLYDDPALLPLPPNANHDMTGKAPHLRRQAEGLRSGNWTLFEPKTFEAGRLRKLRGYLGNISQVDHAAGKALDALDRLGLADDTIVVYTSDHGDYACEFGIMEKAPGICADAITRVPFIWRWPGHVREDRCVTEVVETNDTASTLCALAGLPPMRTADGRDLSAQLAGGPGDADRIGLTEFAWSKSLRQDRYRLVYYPKAMFAADHPDGFGELYDLEADPWEQSNLWFDPAHSETVRRMERALCEHLITTTRPRTIHSPARGTLAEGYRERHHQRFLADGKISLHDCAANAGTNYH